MITFKNFLKEHISWTESGDGEDHFEHRAKIGKINLRITHTLGMAGNKRKMNVSFHHDDYDSITPNEKYKMLHTVKASVKHMIKKHHVNRLTFATASPKHEDLYTRFAKSIGGESTRDKYGSYTVDLP